MTTKVSFAALALPAALAALLTACAGTPTPAPATAPAAAAAPAPAPAPARQPGQPDPNCIALLDQLASEIPPEQSLAVLQTKGMKLVRPLLMLNKDAFQPVEHSGVIVRMRVNNSGRVADGSVQVLKSVGDPRLAQAMSTAAQGVQFDFSAMFRPPLVTVFTTSYVTCATPIK